MERPEVERKSTILTKANKIKSSQEVGAFKEREWDWEKLPQKYWSYW